MDMKKSSGKLRAIGYDAARRLLRVELEGGAALEYSGVSGFVAAVLRRRGWRGVFTATISRMSFRRKRGRGWRVSGSAAGGAGCLVWWRCAICTGQRYGRWRRGCTDTG
jgi:hypothetical protein